MVASRDILLSRHYKFTGWTKPSSPESHRVMFNLCGSSEVFTRASDISASCRVVHCVQFLHEWRFVEEGSHWFAIRCGHVLPLEGTIRYTIRYKCRSKRPCVTWLGLCSFGGATLPARAERSDCTFSAFIFFVFGDVLPAPVVTLPPKETGECFQLLYSVYPR